MSRLLNIQNKLTIIDQESLVRYFNELTIDSRTTPLSPETEVALFIEYKLNGNRKIKDRLILANLRWVITVAKQFSYPKIRLEDLINEGTIGMIKAIDKFDPTKGFTFLTFAVWYIRQEITQYINDTAVDIVQPANRYRIKQLIKQAGKILRARGNETPTSEELTEVYCEIKEKIDPVLSVLYLNEINTQYKGFVSHDVLLSDNDTFTIGDTFKSGSEYNADYAQNNADKLYELNHMLNIFLNTREREIVEYSFGLNGRDEKTLEQLSNIIGVTRERVGQLLLGALNKLKTCKKNIYELCGGFKETSHSIESNHIKYAKTQM